MRKQIVAGNWKMNTTKPEGKELAQEVAALSAGVPEHVGLIVAPPFTHLCAVNKALAGSRVELSAQNCADHEKGAYTGEVSVSMLKAVGCKWVILGHSERRQYYGETDEKLVVKVKLALEAGLGVIAQTVAHLQDTCVAAGTVEHLAANFAEEFGDGDLVLKVAEDYAAGVHGVVLALGDEGLNVLLQCLSLGQSRSDSFVLNQRASHVG